MLGLLVFAVAAFSSLCGSSLMLGISCVTAGSQRVKRSVPCVIAAAVLSALCCGLISACLPFNINDTDTMPGIVFASGFGGLFLCMAGLAFGAMDWDWRWPWPRY